VTIGYGRLTVTEIEVDGSLLFRFSDAWLAVRWEGSAPQVALHRPGRKCVDVAAAGRVALLIEAKDDRNTSASAAAGRRRSVSSGTFLEEIARKANDSAQDLTISGGQRTALQVFTRFAQRWHKGHRCFLLWWELPPEPPSGPGT
jgi:hypothetical protein